MRLPLLPGCAAVVAAAALADTARAQGPSLARWPYVEQTSHHSAIISWHTTEAAEGAVEYGTDFAFGTRVTVPGPSTEHSVRLDGLAPGTRYFYRALAGGTALHPPLGFETAPDPRAPPPVWRFAVFGDSGSGTSDQRDVARGISFFDADLLLHTGDTLYPGGVAADYDPKLFAVYRDTLSRAPIYPALGNQDVDHDGGAAFLDAFHLPEGSPSPERYYSFVHGNALCVVLDSNQSLAEKSLQRAWLEAELEGTDRAWKLVVLHHPLYSSLASAAAARASLEPLFGAHGVDIVFQGHTHYYERTFPLRDGLAVDVEDDPHYDEPQGTIYIVSGGGGGELVTAVPQAYSARYASVFHHVEVTVNGHVLTLEAVNSIGVVFDRMTLVKDPGPPLATRPSFHRADPDDDGETAITDGIYLFNHLFLGSAAAPTCRESADVNNDASVDITDGIQILNYLFLGGLPPAAPGAAGDPCGPDTDPAGEAGDLGCESYTHCPGNDGPALAEIQSLVASYGSLETIAGKGEISANGFNGWDPLAEGGAATAAELSRPHMAMADDAGNIYIADKDAHAIRRMSPGGTIVTVAGTNQPGDDGDEPGPGTERRLSSPNGLWVRGDGTVYILDLDNGKVRRLATGGELTTLFTVPGGIAIGRGLWVNDAETLAYVSSGIEVKRWTPAGGVESYADDFLELGNLVVDAAGDVIITDRGAHRAYRLGPDRLPVPIAGNGLPFGGGDRQLALETGIQEVRGVWLLEGGGYLLATHEGSQIWYVDTRGYIHLFLDGIADDDAHSGDGEHFRTAGFKVSEVRAVTADRDGNILIVENDRGFVRRIRRR
jgi:sugar lactone lactonase YvrE/predicted phosphodiesterase